MRLEELLDEKWRNFLKDEFKKDYFQNLCDNYEKESKNYVIYPKKSQIFSAFSFKEPKNIKVIILGQDPYHTKNTANGLAFSVNEACKIPPSLRNIYKELASDLECSPPVNGDLTSWAKQGVLLLNTSLSVREGEANSHAKLGWESFSKAVISKLSLKNDFLVFILWGKNAKGYEYLIDKRHFVIKSAHPSPFSAKNFFDSRPFSKCNAALINAGKDPIKWEF